MTDKAYGEVLGAFIVGPHATDLISEILGVKASEGTMNELSNIIQPHPSLSGSNWRERGCILWKSHSYVITEQINE